MNNYFIIFRGFERTLVQYGALMLLGAALMSCTIGYIAN